jgi:hypothetical protein
MTAGEDKSQLGNHVHAVSNYKGNLELCLTKVSKEASGKHLMTLIFVLSSSECELPGLQPMQSISGGISKCGQQKIHFYSKTNRLAYFSFIQTSATT